MGLIGENIKPIEKDFNDRLKDNNVSDLSIRQRVENGLLFIDLFDKDANKLFEYPICDATKNTHMAYTNKYLSSIGVDYYDYSAFNSILDNDLNSLPLDRFNRNLMCASINKIRLIIHNNGYMNKYDRYYLNQLGFNNNDYFITIDDLDMNNKTKKVLNKSDFIYIWQLLLMDKEKLNECYLISEDIIIEIDKALKSYGNYHLPSYEEYVNCIKDYPSDPQYDDERDNLNKIIASRTKYIIKIKEDNKKLELLNDEYAVVKTKIDNYKFVK